MTQLNQTDPEDSIEILSNADLLFICPYNEYIDAIDNGTLDENALRSLIMISSSFAFLCEEISKNNPGELEKFSQSQDSGMYFLEALFSVSAEAFQNLIALYSLRREDSFIPALCDAEITLKDKLLCIRRFLTEASKVVEHQRQNQSFRKAADVSVNKAVAVGMTVTDTLQ